MLDSAVKFIEEKIGDFKPEIGIILGSGLGDLADEFCKISIPYSQMSLKYNQHLLSSLIFLKSHLLSLLL